MQNVLVLGCTACLKVMQADLGFVRHLTCKLPITIKQSVTSPGRSTNILSTVSWTNNKDIAANRLTILKFIDPSDRLQDN